MNHHKTRVDQIIQACNKSEWEKSLGTLLLISEGEREALMDEYHGKADKTDTVQAYLTYSFFPYGPVLYGTWNVVSA